MSPAFSCSESTTSASARRSSSCSNSKSSIPANNAASHPIDWAPLLVGILETADSLLCYGQKETTNEQTPPSRPALCCSPVLSAGLVQHCAFTDSVLHRRC